VMKSPAMPGQSRQMPDPPPGEGSLLSLLQVSFYQNRKFL
jgi:hypothetical protein